MISGVSIPIVISLVSIGFSSGIFVGLLAVKFVSKKECRRDMQEMWLQVDAIRKVLMGKKITFELKPVVDES